MSRASSPRSCSGRRRASRRTCCAVAPCSTGNAVLRSLLESLSTRTVRARLWHGAVDRQALDTARAEHTRIYDSIVAGDPDLARSAAMLHIESNERWLREHLDPGAEDVP